MKQGEKIVKAAMEWVGTPHVNGQRVKGAGVDCGQLLIAATEDAGLIERDSVEIKPYSGQFQLHHSEEWFLSYVKQYCREIKDPAKIQPGDFLLYQYGRCISHGAIYIGNGAVLHAVINKGVIASDMDEVQFYDSKGRSRLRGIYRYRRRRK